MHFDALAQASASKKIVPGIREIRQAALPLAGRLAVSKLNLVSMATQTVVFGHAMLVMVWFLSKVNERQARRPPAGLVEMYTRPWLSAATHSTAAGQASAVKVAPGSRRRPCQAEAPPAGLVEVMMPPVPSATQRVVLGQRMFEMNEMACGLRAVSFHLPAAGSDEVTMSRSKAATHSVRAGHETEEIGSAPST